MIPAVVHHRPKRPSAVTIGRSLVVLIVLTVAGTLPADDRRTSSIVEFVAAKDRWDRLVARPMRLEGRYTVLSANDLRFLNCDMEFELTKSFRRPNSTTKNVEVAGQIVRKDGGLVFKVTDLQPRESDGEQLKLKRALVNNSRAEEVYELAEWARQRGQFYEDDELKLAGDQLYREGLTIAYEHLKPGDQEGLRELAKRATEFSLDEGVKLRYLHEANRLEWSAAKAAEKKDYRRMIDVIERDLPGARTPLPADRLGIRKDYQAAPLVVYRVADSATRRLLDRAFLIEVTLANILLNADPDGRNGYALAKQIEQQLPELVTLADTFREQELKYLTARLSKLTRTQMVELSTRFQNRGDEQQAARVKRDWLKAQEPRAAAAGPTELMELGDEYVNLLRDEKRAARMYQLAYQQNPQLPTAAEWLTTRGYDLAVAPTTGPGEMDATPDDATIEEAIQAGRVQVGMTGEQVRQSLGTKPSSVFRVASAGQVSELWVFKDYGLTVRINRRSTSTTSQVVSIDTID